MSINLMIAASPIAAVVTNPRLPDNPIVDCNDAFLALTGYTRDEIMGRNCRFLRGSATEPEVTAKLHSALVHQQPIMVEIRNYKKDGTPFRNAVMIAPVFGADGALEYFLGSQMEVGPNAAGERRVMAAQRIARLSQRQREVLVQIASGKLNKQIAYELGLSERTVKMHRAAVFRALGVSSGADAIRLAIEAGY